MKQRISVTNDRFNNIATNKDIRRQDYNDDILRQTDRHASNKFHPDHLPLTQRAVYKTERSVLSTGDGRRSTVDGVG